MNRFKVKTEICFGENALDLLNTFTDLNVVVITDAFMVQSGAADKITSHLSACKSVSIFGEVRPDPPIELITEGLRFLQNADADLVIALGGGSSIDAAKSVVLMAKNTGKKDIKLIAIPTTSGTGSEVTKFAVITDSQKGLKYPLVDEGLLPDIAILDSDLVLSAPPSVTADTGFDVITHAIEAFTSTLSNDASDALSEKAVSIAMKYLAIAYRDGSNVKAREKMHSASCLAGMAFNEVGLGINHGIAHQIGAKFHIPHGRANAMLLPHVIEFNCDLAGNFGRTEYSQTAQKIAKISRRQGLPSENVKTAILSYIEELKYMMRMMGIPATLAEAKVSRRDYEANKAELIRGALADACTATNPRPVTAADVEAILNKIAIW